MAAQLKQLAAEVERLSQIVQESKRLSLATREVQQSLSKRWRRDDTLFNGHALRNCRAYFPGNCRNCGRWDHQPSPKQSGLELMPCRIRMTILLLNLAALIYQRIPCSSFSFGNRPFSVFHFLLYALALFHSLVLFISMLRKAANECFPPGVFTTSSTRAKAFEHRHGVLRYVAAK